MKKIKVTIHPDGTQKIEVLGAVGEGCKAFTAELEKRLGTEIGERVLKEEYHQTEAVQEHDREVER